MTGSSRDQLSCPTPLEIPTGKSILGQIVSRQPHPPAVVWLWPRGHAEIHPRPGTWDYLWERKLNSKERGGAEGVSSQPWTGQTPSHLSAVSSTSHFTVYCITGSSKTQTISPTWEFFPERLIPCQHLPIVVSCYCLFKELLLSVLTWANLYKNTAFTFLFSSSLSLCWAAKFFYSTLFPSISPHPTWGISFQNLFL